MNSSEGKGASTVCRMVLLCFVMFMLFHQQISANDLCAPGCRCYDDIANCSHCGIGVIPHWEAFSNSLIALDLTGNNLDSLDEGDLIGFVSVHNMSFRNNTIKNVNPSAFQGLSEGLMYLDLSCNMIQKFDSKTFTFIPKLQILLISNNSIAFLENTVFSELKDLLHLDVSFNYLSHVPDGAFDGNRQLEFLSLRHNSIQSISQMTFKYQHNLKHLDLSQNKIEEISKDFGDSIKQVLHLNLSVNVIESVNSLSFAQCNQLETLSIAHNHISKLPQQALYGLFNLKHLDLSHNNLTHFGPEVFVAVRTEYHDGSGDCPQYRSLYKNLKFLKLDNNRISSLDLCVFAPARSLQDIDVSANSLSALDGRTAKWILDSDTAVNLTGACINVLLR